MSIRTIAFDAPDEMLPRLQRSLGLPESEDLRPISQACIEYLRRVCVRHELEAEHVAQRIDAIQKMQRDFPME
jgi:hypothetical protein